MMYNRAMKSDVRILQSSAILSTDRVYRYSLIRTWNDALPRVCFIMLNPSTADETLEDPTIRRCVKFSESWEFGSLEVVNLYAYRSHNPCSLLVVNDPVGRENDKHIHAAVRRAKMTVVAWGTHGHRGPLRRDVLPLVQIAHCIGVTKSGAPRHPLYVHSSALPSIYIG